MLNKFMSNMVEKYNQHLLPLIKQSIPCLISNVFESTMELISMHYIGKLDDPIYLGAVGLGYMWVNITTISVLQGFGFAIQTLCSQSYGNKNYYMCGVYHLRGRFIIFLLGVLLSLLTLLSENIMTFIGIDQKLAHYAYLFAVWLIPSNLALSQFDITKRYLFTLKITFPVVVGMCIMLVFSPLIIYLFVFTFKFSFKGAAIARCILYLINQLFLLIYIHITQCCGETWFWFNKDSFRELWVFIKTGTYGALMLCFEWWGFEIINAMAGNLGSTQLAASVVIFAIINFVYRASMGLQISACSLVGNAIGAQNVVEAKIYTKLSVLLNLVLIAIMSVFIFTFKKSFCMFFTKSEDVLSLISVLIYFVILGEFIDTSNGIFQNVIIGLGKESIASIVNLIAFYAIMIPSAYLLAFKLNWKVYGLWAAIGLAVGFQTIAYCTVLGTMDWTQVCMECSKQLKEETERIASRDSNQNTPLTDVVSTKEI